MENELINLVSNMGFPIVAFLLMYKMCNESLSKVTDALNELKNAFTEMREKINNDKED